MTVYAIFKHMYHYIRTTKEHKQKKESSINEDAVRYSVDVNRGSYLDIYK